MLTQEYLKKHLKYDPETGEFWWLIPGPRRYLNQQAGTTNKRGYRMIKIKGKNYQASRLAFFYMLGVWPYEIDHIDRNTSNDKWRNLRDCTTQENALNRGTYQNSTSGVTGVSWHRRNQKWRAHIHREGKSYHLGYFTDFKDAVKARKDAETYY